MDQQAWKRPSRTRAAWFWLRSRYFIAKRSVLHITDRSFQRWPASQEMVSAPVLATVKTGLWDDERAEEFILLAGKVHNLRVASRSLHAVVVPANACLSFWRQVGCPSRSRGYVVGRELREGCVIPTIAGGLCQLSNALAAAAVQAGFELVERHAHSASTEREGVIDATVFWNYVDLRLRAPVPWRLEVVLTDSELVLTIRARSNKAASSLAQAQLWSGSRAEGIGTGRPQYPLRNCLSCEEVACFRHQPELRNVAGSTAWLLDGVTPEFLSYLAVREPPKNRFQPLPLRQLCARILGRPVTDGWSSIVGRVDYIALASLRRAWRLRCTDRVQGQRQAALIDGARWLATAYVKKLRPEHTHLIVDQALLPHLYQLGALAGRSYEVLTPALPMQEIHRRLDRATQSKFAATSTLTDFRAEQVLLQAEVEAMRHAKAVVTAHAEVADYWMHGGAAVVRLPWMFPPVTRYRAGRNGTPVIVFPASALARKGAYELAAALQGIPCRLLVLGSRSDDVTMWDGIDAAHVDWWAGAWMPHADLLVLPAYIEHSPRALLQALSLGIPVIATPACGLHGMEGVRLVPSGEVSALRHAIVTGLGSMAARLP